MAVENRKTPAAIASNVWHMVAKKWNDPSISPSTSVKESHSDFSQPIVIHFDAVAKLLPATPEKVEEKWNSMNLALKRGITNWERSGQGDGGYIDNNEDDATNNNGVAVDGSDDDDDETVQFGVLAGRSQGALDMRRNFFDDKATYLLYLWDILDEHDLVQSTMQQLLEGVGSGNGSTGVPSVIRNKRINEDDDYDSLLSKKSKTNEDADAFAQLSCSIEKHSNSLVDAAKIAAGEQAKNRTQSRASEIHARINSLQDSKRDMALRMTMPNIHQIAVNAILHEIKGIEDEIAANTEELNILIATPTKSNCSPN